MLSTVNDDVINIHGLDQIPIGSNDGQLVFRDGNMICKQTLCPNHSKSVISQSVRLVAMVTTHGAVDCCNFLLAHTTVGCYGYHTGCCDYLSSCGYDTMAVDCGDYNVYHTWNCDYLSLHIPLLIVMVTTHAVVDYLSRLFKWTVDQSCMSVL